MDNLSYEISLRSIESVKDFVKKIEFLPYDACLVTGRYVIEAKSILGIFSLDLTKPITLNIYGCDSEENIEYFLNAISDVIIDK